MWSLISSKIVGAQFQHSPGQLVNLLRVAVADEVDMGTRQAAAISFKNLVRKDWEGTGARCHSWLMRQRVAVRFDRPQCVGCMLFVLHVCFNAHLLPSQQVGEDSLHMRASSFMPFHGNWIIILL